MTERTDGCDNLSDGERQIYLDALRPGRTTRRLKHENAALRAENERLREHLGHALGLYHLGQRTGYVGEDAARTYSMRHSL